MDKQLNKYLIKAVENEIFDFVEDFIINGADVNIKNEDEETPLFIASLKGNLQIVNKLIQLKAQVEAKNKDGCTPLYIASQNGHLDVVRELIEKNAQVEAKNKDGCTPLYIASQNGHLDVIKELIDQRSQVDTKNKDRCTPLHVASQNGHLDVVRELIEKNAQVEAKNKDGCTPLYIASQNGHLDVIKELIDQRAQVDTKNKDRCTPLHVASQNGHLNVIKELIEQGSQLNPKNNNGFTPLHIASLNGHLEVIKKLKEQGSQVDTKDNNGFTPLHIASQNGHLDVIKELIELGAPVHTENYNGCTPLYIASQNGHLDVVKELIKLGAIEQVKTTNNTGWTPLLIASQNGHQDVVKHLIIKGATLETSNNNGWSPLLIASQNGHLGVVRELIKKNAQVEAKNKDKCTPLYIASQNGHLDVVRELIKKNAQVEAKNKDECTPLYIASQNGHLDVVRELIEKNAQVEAKNKDECTPLYIASQNGHLDVARELIEKNAQVEAKNKDECTPLYIASMNGHLDVVKELTKHGAKVDATTNDGLTPLLIATQNGNLDVVTWLVKELDSGANYNISNIHNYISLHIATTFGFTKIVKILIDNKVEVNAKCRNGWTPLMIAVNNKHNDIVNYLLSKGADINIKNNFGVTALMIAAGHKEHAIASKLLEKNAQVNDVNLRGWTSLIIAADTGNYAMVQKLRKYKANVNWHNTFGDTALKLAFEKKHEEVHTLLITNGAWNDETFIFHHHFFNCIKFFYSKDQNYRTDSVRYVTEGKNLFNKRANSEVYETKPYDELCGQVIKLIKKSKISDVYNLRIDVNCFKNNNLLLSLKFIQQNDITIPIKDYLHYELLKMRVTCDKANVDKSSTFERVGDTIIISAIEKHLDEILNSYQPVNLILFYHIKQVIFYSYDLMVDFKFPWKKIRFFLQQYIISRTTECNSNILHESYITDKNLRRFLQLIKTVILQKNNIKVEEKVVDFENTVNHLNNIYDVIRDVFILNRIDKYIQVWKNKRYLKRPYWSTLRLLQVIGESFKSLYKSPNLSEHRNFMKQYLIENDFIQIKNYVLNLTGIPNLVNINDVNIIKNTESLVHIIQQIRKDYMNNLSIKNDSFIIKNLDIIPSLMFDPFKEKLLQRSSKSVTFETYTVSFFKYIDISNSISNNYYECLEVLSNALDSDNILELEFVLLAVLNHLNMETKTLNRNSAWFRDECPTLTGAQLRNHLAHGDPIVQILNIDEEMAIRNTAKLLIKNWTPIFTEKQTERPTREEEEKLGDEELKRLEVKEHLFALISKGDLEKLTKYIDTFDEISEKIWIHWCNHRQENILQQAAQNKEDNLDLFKFIYTIHRRSIDYKYKIERSIEDLAEKSKNHKILDYVSYLIKNQ